MFPDSFWFFLSFLICNSLKLAKAYSTSNGSGSVNLRYLTGSSGGGGAKASLTTKLGFSLSFFVTFGKIFAGWAPSAIFGAARGY